jgi:hypothetical protein
MGKIIRWCSLISDCCHLLFNYHWSHTKDFTRGNILSIRKMSHDESLSCTVMFVWSKVIVIERERSFKYCTLSISKDFCLESQFEKKKGDQDTFAYFAYLLKCKQWYSTFCDFFLIPVFIFVHIRACILDRQPNAKFKRISYSILKREMYII